MSGISLLTSGATAVNLRRLIFDTVKARVIPRFDIAYAHALKALATRVSTLVREMSEQEEVRVLMLGFGTGTVAKRVLDADPRASLVGVDSDEELWKQAASCLRNPQYQERVQAERATAQALSKGPFDLVVVAMALSDLSKDERATFLKEAHDALVPGGAILIADRILPHALNDRRSCLNSEKEKVSPLAGLPRQACLNRRWKAFHERPLRSLLAVSELSHQLNKVGFERYRLRSRFDSFALVQANKPGDGQ